MNEAKQTLVIAKIMLFVFFLAVLGFFYRGVTEKQIVSEDYNVPIVRQIIAGKFIHVVTDNPYLHYPASSHVIMAALVLLGLPVNLLGLISWLALVIICRQLGLSFGLNKIMSLIFSLTFCFTLSVIRTVADQSIDKWLCFWFVWSLLLLHRPIPTRKFSLLLGFTLGMLVGTKYSGPLFFIALGVVYWPTLLKFSRLSTILAFTVSGLFWYIRNFIFYHNPLYPGNFPFLKGAPGFVNQDWYLWKVPVYYPPGLIQLLNAYLSEYLIWSLAWIPILFFFFRHREILDPTLKKLGRLILAIGVVSLFLPITTPFAIEYFHTVSDMRYIYILVVPQVLFIFLLASKFKVNFQLALISFLNILPSFSFIGLYPKIFLLGLLGLLTLTGSLLPGRK